jgi:hypothetical protein
MLGLDRVPLREICRQERELARQAKSAPTCADLAPDAGWVCEEHGRSGVAGCKGPWRPAEPSDG